MPIQGFDQPEVIQIDETLRLRKFDDHYDFALSWYQDEEMVYLVDGVRQTYTMEKLSQMYHYLNDAGELYFIEVMEKDMYKPIGDVTFWQEDMPIVIGDPEYRGKGIGRKVVSALIERGKELGYDALHVSDIYDYNTASKRCFESVGFVEHEKTEKGSSYIYHFE